MWTHPERRESLGPSSAVLLVLVEEDLGLGSGRLLGPEDDTRLLADHLV